MVCVGWAPYEKIRDAISKQPEYFKTFENDSEKPYISPQTSDPFTGFVYNIATEDEIEFEREDLS